MPSGRNTAHNCQCVVHGAHALNPSQHWLRIWMYTWKRDGTLKIPSLQHEDSLIGQVHHLFSKKTTPQKISKAETRSQKKFCKSRKMNGGCYIPANAAKPTDTQPSTLVTPSLPLPNTMAQAKAKIGQLQQI